MFVVCCVLCDVRCSVFVVRCLRSVVNCVLFVDCAALFCGVVIVVRCLRFVALFAVR